jgi:hypothetical protein
MKASDVVQAIVNALKRKPNPGPADSELIRNEASDYVTHLIVPKGGAIEVDREKLSLLGVKEVVEVAASIDEEIGVVYDPEGVVRAIGGVLLGHGLAQMGCVSSLQ